MCMNSTTLNLQEKNHFIKFKLASIWTSFMFLYTYVDYFHLYMPGKIEEILKGKVYVFDITPGFLAFVTIMVIIPVLMIFLSIALPTKINRLVNMIVAIFYIPYMLFNLSGEAWPHMVLAAIVEVFLLCLVIYYSWRRFE